MKVNKECINTKEINKLKKLHSKQQFTVLDWTQQPP